MSEDTEKKTIKNTKPPKTEGSESQPAELEKRFNALEAALAQKDEEIRTLKHANEINVKTQKIHAKWASFESPKEVGDFYDGVIYALNNFEFERKNSYAEVKPKETNPIREARKVKDMDEELGNYDGGAKV